MTTWRGAFAWILFASIKCVKPDHLRRNISSALRNADRNEKAGVVADNHSSTTGASSYWAAAQLRPVRGRVHRSPAGIDVN